MQENIVPFPSRKPPETEQRYKSCLPTQLTSFIGREQEVAAVCALLRRPEVRLLTLTGSGGVGKTRLALHIVNELLHDFTDGIFFVSLAPISDPDLVIAAMAQTLGFRGTADQPLLEHLKAFLRNRHILLLLDNFEQILSAAPTLSDLLTACPALNLLVTSRTALRIYGEHEFLVSPFTLPNLKHLPDPEALSQFAVIALFIQRAQAVRPDFQVTPGNAHTIAEICVRLDGLPLAIELAAARIKLLPPQALLSRLGHRLQVLTRGARNMPIRQQTLRNTIQWSYDLLNVEEQRLFRRLSIFVGGCTLEATEAICNAANDLKIEVLEGVSSLIDKSLLQQAEYEAEEPRLVLLETIREYGLECLVESGEMEGTRWAHALYYLRLTKMVEPELTGPKQALWLERLEQDHDNLRAALHWLIAQEEKEMALCLSGMLFRFWRVRGHASEGRQWLDQALIGSEGVQAMVRAKALFAATELAFYQQDGERSRSLLEERLALYKELGDKRGVAHTLMWLSPLSWRNNQAHTIVEDALVLFKELGDREGIADALTILGYLSISRGEYARTLALHEECLQIFKDVGDKEGQASLLSMALARVALYQGDHVRASRYAQEGLELFRELGDRGGMALSLNVLGEIALNQGNLSAARSQLEEGLARAKEVGNKLVIAETLSLLARMAFSQHDYDAAYTLYKDSLIIAEELNYTRLMSSGLEGLGEVVTAQGQPFWAAQLWGVAETLREVEGELMSPVERVIYEPSVAAARGHLGEEAFAVAWAEGQTMTPEQILVAGRPVPLPEQAPSLPQPTTSSKPSSTYPAGLTAREVEILRLVAQGLIDAQVANQLVISPRTVNSHLTSIYSKIGVSSRSAATRYAIEQKLV